LQSGYDLKCLGHVYPPEIGKDSDCYMYQTVGSECVDLIAKAIDKPLLKEELTGIPKVTSMLYSDVPEEIKDDEVEDMFRLLQRAK